MLKLQFRETVKSTTDQLTMLRFDIRICVRITVQIKPALIQQCLRS